MTKTIIGIDEAGRGPIAGPVAVGAVAWKMDDGQVTRKIKELLPTIKDSKQLSEKKREEIFAGIVALSKTTTLRYSVALVSAKHIDTYGISASIRKGIEGVLKRLEQDKEKIKTGSDPFFALHQSHILLDGGLKAPEIFVNQKTYIRGDATHLSIALASIAAKVLRDRHMIALAKKHPNYGFEKHKGYGTKAHYEALAKFGEMSEHRKSFLKNIDI